MQSVRTEHPVVSNIAPSVAKSGRTGTRLKDRNFVTFLNL
jgi:hypothetical protein